MAKPNQVHQALNRLLDSIRDALTPEAAEAIVNLRADQATQDLLDDLAERHHESQLTPEELSEYEALVAAVELVSVLQAKARSVLKSRKAS
jgi:hypothetical protein